MSKEYWAGLFIMGAGGALIGVALKPDAWAAISAILGLFVIDVGHAIYKDAKDKAKNDPA